LLHFNYLPGIMKVIVVLLALIVSISLASVTRRENWKLVRRASGNENHTVAIALKPKQGSVEYGDKILSMIHTPSSSRYMKHLTVSEINEIFIDSEALAKVEHYLNQRQISFTTKGDFLWATTSVNQWEQLLKAEFHHFSHNNYPSTILRSKQYAIPSEISDEVSIVFQVDDFPPAHNKLNHVEKPLAYADPTVLRTVYQVPNVGLTNNNQSQGVLGANGGFFSSDLSAFFSMFGTNSIGAIYIVSYQAYNSTACADMDCGEPTLDMQYIMSMAPGATTIFFNSIQDAFADSFNWLSSGSGTPQSFSMSLGVTGASSDYEQRLCTEAQKATLRGTTLFAASGDGGGFDNNCNIYDTFPSACPYITAVGGTQGPESGQKEQVWAHSGAGSAGSFPMPSWQTSYAQNYFNTVKNLPNFPRTQRLYPDIAGCASILPLIQKGTLSYAAGTSFASPTFAGIFTQIAILREQANKAPIGFLNNALSYLNGLGANYNPLNDITTGQSQGNCNDNLPAITGWDMGTGWGTANYPLMKFYLMQL